MRCSLIKIQFIKFVLNVELVGEDGVVLPVSRNNHLFQVLKSVIITSYNFNFLIINPVKVDNESKSFTDTTQASKIDIENWFSHVLIHPLFVNYFGKPIISYFVKISSNEEEQREMQIQAFISSISDIILCSTSSLF